ncbi:hypothetical protein ACFQ4O_02365 [Methylopila musalis]|uniref:GPI inositol-deacylase PGAP1-like alpha/beta domain-containing protein n=1 Tax=Methylopila musalis TaxID=1134781 RepID=A0ABW3Z3P0_9HYPH
MPNGQPQAAQDDKRATRSAQPIILIRGFGGLGVEDEKRVAYQGFNDGTVYHKKRGENYIYEGLVLRFLKSKWTYADATNVVGYYEKKFTWRDADIPSELKTVIDPTFFSGQQVVIDPGMALAMLKAKSDISRTIWVFRYYDLGREDGFELYGDMLYRLIQYIRALAVARGDAAPKVNIIAHSMGGLIARDAIQRAIPKGEAPRLINKVVTLGTPHQGIAFQVLKNWVGLEASRELERFNPDTQKIDPRIGFKALKTYFPLERILTVVGTNFGSYGPYIASWLNRLSSVPGEFGMNYNRSDGLVKQAYAQLPGAPRTFVHKCHGGVDSLVTSREAFEIATRFFFGNVKVALILEDADIRSGGDWFGKNEFFFGVSVKPRKVDFDLFHQSEKAENCYGPFDRRDLKDENPAFGWASNPANERLVWEGWLDTTAVAPGRMTPITGVPTLDDATTMPNDVLIRLDIYVGERDTYGVGHSDTLIFHKQRYARAVLNADGSLETMSLHLTENTGDAAGATPMEQVHAGDPTQWRFSVGDDKFQATFKIRFAMVPENG